MKSKDLIRWSLEKSSVERLVVALGLFSTASPSSKHHRSSGGMLEGSTRASAACCVFPALIHHCQPPPSDIHDPDETRAAARSAKGTPRDYYSSYTQEISRPSRYRIPLRRPQTWDSAPVPDFMGRWCDRLLLGDTNSPQRTAVLLPTAPPVFQPECIRRVALSHPQLSQKDVLLVDTSPALPFGVLRQLTFHDYLELKEQARSPSTCEMEAAAAACRQWESSSTARLNEDGRTVNRRDSTQPCSLAEAVASFSPSSPIAAPSVSVLVLGCGQSESYGGPLTPLSRVEEELLETLLAPLMAFLSALWSVDPSMCEAYATRETFLPDTIRQSSRGAAGISKLALWRSLQYSMLSTRDTALLRAHFSQQRLDRRLSAAHQTYLAETLLRRLSEKDCE